VAEPVDADLLLIYPKAKVQANRIITELYIFVVKRFLFWYMVTENFTVDHVPHSQAFARLLRRLSRELRSAPPSGGFQFAYCSDPCDYLECLDEMLRDIEETRESLKAREGTLSPDKHVYVGRSIDIYVQCLIAAAAELHTCN